MGFHVLIKYFLFKMLKLLETGLKFLYNYRDNNERRS